MTDDSPDLQSLPRRHSTSLDNARAARDTVSKFENVLSDANKTIAHLAYHADRGDLQPNHKEQLGALYAELLGARREFENLVSELPEKAQRDSRVSDVRNAIDVLAARSRKMM